MGDQSDDEQQHDAEPYVHQDMPYVHDATGDAGETYVHDTTGDVAEPSVKRGGNSRAIGRRRVAVKKDKTSQSSAASRSFSFQTESEDQQFSEQADSEGERIGSYSY